MSDNNTFKRVEGVIDRLSFGLMLLIPSSIVFVMFLFVAGKYASSIMIFGPALVGICYFLGDFVIQLIGRDTK